MQEWNELEDEFVQNCGGQKTKMILTHGGRQLKGAGARKNEKVEEVREKTTEIGGSPQ